MRTRKRDPRPADLAISNSRCLLAQVKMIWEMSYKRHKPSLGGSALELMFVSFLVQVTTDDGTPMTPTALARELKIPRSSVARDLEELVRLGRVKKTGRVYVSDLDTLDELMTQERLDRSLALSEECVRRLKDLRGLLWDRLRPT